MSAAITTVYAYLDHVDPALGQEARAIYKAARSIKAVYALVRQRYGPDMEAVCRQRYAEGCKAAYLRDKYRLDMQVARMRSRV